ncbi:unnamed protein product [Pleuronectes platessa]|uniref:Uncharacterized protein n=1 Tax=Pleuronectes platessa TaxID=8262 RepID=A0A9N7YIX2_PLEPL|nr:unnamed protein product [Pleuronectes platessa]
MEHFAMFKAYDLCCSNTAHHKGVGQDKEGNLYIQACDWEGHVKARHFPKAHFPPPPLPSVWKKGMPTRPHPKAEGRLKPDEWSSGTGCFARPIFHSPKPD